MYMEEQAIQFYQSYTSSFEFLAEFCLPKSFVYHMGNLLAYKCEF